MKLPKLTAKRRLWLYGVAAAGLAVLVVMGLIAAEQLPAWLLLAGAILGVSGNATAAGYLAKQRKDGTVEK